MNIFISDKKDETVVSEIIETTKTREKPKVQQTIQIVCDQTTKAEIIWSLHVISSHMSMSASGKSIVVMKSTFEDSNTAKNINVQRTKLTKVDLISQLPRIVYWFSNNNIHNIHSYIDHMRGSQ